MTNYHARIMNLQHEKMNMFVLDQHAYRSGHRDARHAAAGIALEADHEIAAKDAEIARLTDLSDPAAAVVAYGLGYSAGKENSLLVRSAEIERLHAEIERLNVMAYRPKSEHDKKCACARCVPF